MNLYFCIHELTRRVIVCIDCSGIHRNLGVHISVVKSLTLDKWQPKWIDMCSKIGNRVGNAYYENRLPSSFRRPTHGDGVALVENFIRAKYQRLEFVTPNCEPPCGFVARGVNPATSSATSSIKGSDVSRSSTHSAKSADISKTASVESFDLLGGLSPANTCVPPTKVASNVSFDLLDCDVKSVEVKATPNFPPAWNAPAWPFSDSGMTAPGPIASGVKTADCAGLAGIDPFAMIANRK